jgi:hypothetical protein
MRRGGGYWSTVSEFNNAGSCLLFEITFPKKISIQDKMKEFQQNHFEHILIVVTYRIPRKILNYHIKRIKERERMRWKDEFA